MSYSLEPSGLNGLAEPQALVNFRWEEFFVWLAAAALTFFISGLLYPLRLERVDNLGAYRIPSETGLFIPSDYSNYPRTSPDSRG